MTERRAEQDKKGNKSLETGEISTGILSQPASHLTNKQTSESWREAKKTKTKTTIRTTTTTMMTTTTTKLKQRLACIVCKVHSVYTHMLHTWPDKMSRREMVATIDHIQASRPKRENICL